MERCVLSWAGLHHNTKTIKTIIYSEDEANITAKEENIDIQKQRSKNN